MTIQHTKEQWRADSDLSAVFVIRDHKLQHVADFGKSLLPETQANMRLITCAPELLATLRGLHYALSRMIDKHDPDSIEAEWLSHSNEVITKATKP